MPETSGRYTKQHRLPARNRVSVCTGLASLAHHSNMGLFNLPPEIIKDVFDFVGPGYFHQDVGRLAVSRIWFDFARPVHLSYIRLSCSSLRPILKSLRDRNILAAVQQCSATIDLCLDQHDTWHADPVDPAGQHQTPSRELSLAGQDLEELGGMLRGFSTLRTLRIYPGPEKLRIENFALSSLISGLPRLTSLDIDLANVEYLDWPGEPPAHLCKSISTLLPSLEHLRCRLPWLVRSAP